MGFHLCFLVTSVFRCVNYQLGAIQKVRHSPRGGGGLGEKVTKCDKGGRGVRQKSDVTHPKFFICTFSKISPILFCHIHVLMQVLFYCTCFDEN